MQLANCTVHWRDSSQRVYRLVRGFTHAAAAAAATAAAAAAAALVDVRSSNAAAADDASA
jgi:methionyl-tRNA formyltransferase